MEIIKHSEYSIAKKDTFKVINEMIEIAEKQGHGSVNNLPFKIFCYILGAQEVKSLSDKEITELAKRFVKGEINL